MSNEQVTQEIQGLAAQIKSLAKMVRKIKAKLDDPDGAKAAERAKNNGFNRKNAISEKLREFLGVEPGTLISRSEVTKFVNAYITDKGLKDPENGRAIVLDDRLRALLAPPDGTQVTFLNLQKFLSPHYTKVA